MTNTKQATSINVQATWRKLEKRPGIKTRWQRAADKGEDLFTNPAHSLLHRVGNRVLLYNLLTNTLTVFAFIAMLLLPEGRDLYFFSLFLGALCMQAFMMTLYKVKTRPHSKTFFRTLFSISYIFGLCYVGAFVIGIRPYNAFHCLYGLLAIPFFFLTREDLWLIISLEIFAGALILFLALSDFTALQWVLPAEYVPFVFTVLSLLSYSGIIIALYFFWIVVFKP